MPTIRMSLPLFGCDALGLLMRRTWAVLADCQAGSRPAALESDALHPFFRVARTCDRAVRENAVELGDVARVQLDLRRGRILRQIAAALGAGDRHHMRVLVDEPAERD